MKWFNLQNNKCPQCSASLVHAYDPVYKKFICRCGFQISEEKYKSIVADRTSQMIDDDNAGMHF